MISIIVLSIPASRDLFKAGGFTSHDLTHHVIRQIAMDKILSQGQLPPRWVDYLNNGYGYPLFIFNYPLPPLVGEIFHTAGLDFLYSVKAVLILSLFLSVLGSFFFLRDLFGDFGAFLGSLVYLYSPSRFIDTYVAADLGSALGMAIIPWLFWVIVKVGKKPNLLNSCIGGVILALLILSHNITVVIFGIPILIFILLQFYFSKFNKNTGFKLLLVLIFGFGLTAFFWINALLDKNLTRYDSILRYGYQNQFPQFIQLLRSPWEYGLSHPGTPGGISYELGLIQIASVILLSLLILLKKVKGEDLGYSFFAVFFFLLSIFLTINISKPFWDNLPLLYLVLFPWRFEALATFCASIAAASVAVRLPMKNITLVLGVILILYTSRNHWHINEVYNPGEEYYKSLKSSSTSFDEELPFWLTQKRAKPAEGKFEFISGGGQIRTITDKAIFTRVEVEATQTSRLQFNQIYFPGWSITTEPPIDQIDYLDKTRGYDLPNFQINKGEYIITAEFKNTSQTMLFNLISISFFVFTVLVIIKSLFKFK